MSWLFAWVFFTGLSVGALAWLQIHHLTLGRWGDAWQPEAGAAARALPLMLLATIVWAGHSADLFPWEQFPAHRRALYSLPQVLGRTGFTLLVWSWFAFRCSRPGRRQGAAAAGLLSILVLGSLLAFDLIMSLDPHFYSSLFGLIVLLVWALSGLAALILFAPADRRRCYDWGGLLLACLMLLTYLDFSQLLIIWSGNLPEESGWLQLRVWGAWKAMACTLLVCFAAIPFLLLMIGPLKRKPGFVRAMAAWLLLGCLAHTYWLIWPAASARLELSASALFATLLLGALWMLNFWYWRARLGGLRGE